MALVSDFDGFIFDYGGVLVEHQTDGDQLEMAAIAGLSPELFTKAYWDERTEYDRGTITAVEYWNQIAKAASGTLTPEQINQLTEADTSSWMKYDEVMWQWIAELSRAGKRVAMLSNMPLDLGVALKSRTERLTIFDQVTLSYELHSTKPEPAIYEQCLEGIGTPAERTLFLDDRLENVTGADALGIRGMQFTSRDEVLLRLRP